MLLRYLKIHIGIQFVYCLLDTYIPTPSITFWILITHTKWLANNEILNLLLFACLKNGKKCRISSVQALLISPPVSVSKTLNAYFPGSVQCRSLWCRMSCSLWVKHYLLEYGMTGEGSQGESPLIFHCWWWNQGGSLSYCRSALWLSKVRCIINILCI